jgi:hypothetical protein
MTKDPLFKEVTEETLQLVLRERSKRGVYSSWMLIQKAGCRYYTWGREISWLETAELI